VVDVRVLVAGGAGMIGSFLCEQMVARGDEVVCMDNFVTGRPSNTAALECEPGFSLVQADVCEPLPELGRFDAVLHLASPASPRDFATLSLEILDAGSIGTRHLLTLATRNQARFLLASTSEVYGDPAVSPQDERYWGHVNPVGPRSVYDEAKRFAEALATASSRRWGTEIRIARIFNTYGPRLRAGDGRVVGSFVRQALAGEPITVAGNGTQTRSFCYITDMVAGLLALLDSSYRGPVNLGNPREMTIKELASAVLELTGSSSPVSFGPRSVDDPRQRCPDISLARGMLGWEPAVTLREGLQATIDSLAATS
jgi:dTDP-glucose 4,6-dehydratase